MLGTHRGDTHTHTHRHHPPQPSPETHRPPCGSPPPPARLPFLSRYILTLMSPALAAAAVVIIFALVTAMVMACSGKQRGGRSCGNACRDRMAAWLAQQRHIATLLFVLFVAYMPIVSSS